MSLPSATSLLRRASDLPRKTPAKATLRGEGVRNFLADVGLGAVVERAIALSNLTKDQAARCMGYESAASVSRWIANEEAPNLSRMWGAEELRAGLVAALAEHVGFGVEVETNIRIRTRRPA
jgi:hypothetical protein